MLEQAPTDQFAHSNINSLRRKTHSERDQIRKKEISVKAFCELCILRCIRPDQLQESMDRYAKVLINQNYIDFHEHIVKPLKMKKKDKSKKR